MLFGIRSLITSVQQRDLIFVALRGPKSADDVNFQDSEKMETNVYWSNRGGADVDDREDGVKSSSTS